MSFFIQGVGAVTPLAPNAAETWRTLCDGAEAPREQVPRRMAGRRYFYCPLPAKFMADAAQRPRLRRSSALSLAGVTAASDAIEDAGLKVGPELGERCAVIFAICSGGVNYTRRFYHEIATQGASGASPLLFPETVFNAPASHVASILNLDGKSYTLVGDSSVGLSAIHFATQLLATDPEMAYCLVVGTEEMDWLVSDAFGSWLMASHCDQFEVYGRREGTVFGEAAGAVVLGRENGLRIARSSAGQSFFSINEAYSAAAEVFSQVVSFEQPDLVVSSANGTFADEVERQIFQKLGGAVPVYAYKPALGEALGAGALLQVVLASLALRSGCLPGTLRSGTKLAAVNRTTRSIKGCSRALVTVIGFNQQVNALLIER
ncbi:MAG: beta-ketoacyl synthase N-terminal-like domain-containing protein [Chthoniobacterales bacterium]